MSREYKFRAWDETAKQMILPTDIYGDVRDELLISLAGDVFLCKEESNGNYCPPTLEVKAARNIILMQYTGLIDENKKKIYEGDIMDYGWAKKEVVFSYGSFGVVNQHPDGGVSVGTYQISNGVVIGNIYENPELLNKK